MPDIRQVALVVVAAVVGGGTIYSVAYDTYLDTSNPLLANLPHPLSATTYWARKSNWLNVYFIKFAWGWTSAAFLLSWLTSPAANRTSSRVVKWVVETGCWMIFTSWFFGPALIDRVIVASGGECIITVPGSDHITLPIEMCYTKSPISHLTHPTLFTDSFVPPRAGWTATPRLRKGHDVSGHIFLLTMSILFLVDQLRPSLRLRVRTLSHTVAVVANVALIGLWLFASYTTSLYFHSPAEKVSGFSRCPLTFPRRVTHSSYQSYRPTFLWNHPSTILAVMSDSRMSRST